MKKLILILALIVPGILSAQTTWIKRRHIPQDKPATTNSTLKVMKPATGADDLTLTAKSTWIKRRYIPQIKPPTSNSTLKVMQNTSDPTEFHRLITKPQLALKQVNPYPWNDLVTPSIPKQCLDSVINESYNNTNQCWHNEYKKLYTYDVSGNVTSYTTHGMDDQLGCWVPSEMTTYQYDNHNNPTFIIKKVWDPLAKKWVSQLREDITYNNQDQVTEHLYHEWSASVNGWIASIRNETGYDANGNINLYLLEIWDVNLHEWIPDFKETWQYNNANNPVDYHLYLWDKVQHQWVLNSVGGYTYDLSGYLITYTFSSSDPQTTLLSNEFRHEYQYDPYGHLAEDVFSVWEPGSQQWDPESKDEFVHHPNGKLMQANYLLWDDSLQWVNSWKEEFLYTPAWKLAVYTYFEWQGNPGQWVLYERRDMQSDNKGNLLLMELKSLATVGPHTLENNCQQVYTYDYTYSLNNLVYPTWFMDETVPFFNMLTGRTWYCWNKTQQAWNYGARESMYYSQNKPNGIPDAKNAVNIRVWPNPSASEVHFDLDALQQPATVELMTITGELVLSQDLSSGNTVNVSHLPSGTYLYTLHYPEGSAKGKLMVQQN